MHVVTHVLSGWCAGNLFRLSARERVCCMAAASLADLDGLGILVSQNAYWNYHHKLTHNLPFGLLVTIALVLISKRRVLASVLYLALFHLHLLMDYFGSGRGWPIYYLWPFSNWAIDNTHASWEFYSWQNISIGLALIIWTFWIAIRMGRTPIELPMPNLDRQIVAWLRQRFTRREHVVVSTSDTRDRV